MKTITHTMIVCALVGIAACHSTRKNKSSETASGSPATPARSSDGIFAPGDAELKAVAVKFPDVTMQTLTEGHSLYTGACTHCHGAKNIYSRPVERWPSIIDNMAAKAKFTEAQKDAVLKYVLSIKATQPS
jgi:hypothetical protein